MAMSEKNESYLFDLLQSMDRNLKDIRRTLMFMSFAFGLFILGSLVILNSWVPHTLYLLFGVCPIPLQLFFGTTREALEDDFALAKFSLRSFYIREI